MRGNDGTEAPEQRVERLLGRPSRAPGLTHVEVLPARAAQHDDWPTWLAPSVREALAGAGMAAPYTHQRRAAELAHAGEHVLVATGTASGKSACYLLPALHAVETARGPKGQRGAGVLYLSPTKALAQDQLAAVRRLGLPVRAATHDGDSTPEERAWVRDHAEYVLTNPDMLHRSMLPGHTGWTRFWSTLRYVVVDECHHYRGVFGAHVAHVLRRLRRVAALHGASPTFVLASATVAEPAVLGASLTGLDVVPVTDDGSPRGRTALAMYEPPPAAGAPVDDDLEPVPGGASGRRSATAEVADLLTDLVVEGVRTLAFVRSRKGVESVASSARRLLGEVDPTLREQVTAYRGGYLPEERRALEQALRAGRLTGLAATNALELGIDVSGLDAVLLAGYPGTRAATWQQIGRAGRSAGDALAVLVARDDPLDTYLVHHPELLVGAPVEANVFDPGNPYVLGPHLCAAAAEAPLRHDELDLFGPTAREAVDALTAGGLLRRRPHGWFWTDRRRACDLANIRSSGGSPVQLVEHGTGRVLGTVDGGAAHGSAHAGAVYVHQGETWVVDGLDLEHSVATLTRDDPGYSTSARETTDITVVSEREHETWGRATLSLGEVEVTHQVVSFLKRRVPSGEVIAEELLDLPPRTLRTTAVWWTLPPDLLAGCGVDERDLPGAAHAAEHASIGLLPLVATCDRWDLGGVSTALHPDTGMLTVFVHDGHPGGAGFAERGFRAAPAWLRATRDAIASCACTSGCPSCVQSPKCGNQNNPLDKAGAVRLLDLLLAAARPDATLPAQHTPAPVPARVVRAS